MCYARALLYPVISPEMRPHPRPHTGRLSPLLQSGIDISDELLSLYDQVKLKHANKWFSFSLQKSGQTGVKSNFEWRIDNKVEPCSDDKNEEVFKAMVKGLPADDSRFVVFDFTETKDDGRQIKKLLLIKWCPDTVNFRLKPVVGATYQTLKEKLQGLGKVSALPRGTLSPGIAPPHCPPRRPRP
jgi:hypothetical protein